LGKVCAAILLLVAGLVLSVVVISWWQSQPSVTRAFRETEPPPNAVLPLDDKLKEKAAAKAKAEAAALEAQRCEAEMVSYELAKARYHAAGRLNVARRLTTDAESENANGNDREAERLLNKAKQRCQELVDRYPDAEEASDARLILDGKAVPPRRVPPVPVLPRGVNANEDELAGKPVRLQGPNLPAGPARAIFVRGYTMQNGTHVAPHYVIVAPAP
jgi:hypothetical protein